jgi:hypothetical protein
MPNSFDFRLVEKNLPHGWEHTYPKSATRGREKELIVSLLARYGRPAKYTTEWRRRRCFGQPMEWFPLGDGRTPYWEVKRRAAPVPAPAPAPAPMVMSQTMGFPAQQPFSPPGFEPLLSAPPTDESQSMGFTLQQQWAQPTTGAAATMDYDMNMLSFNLANMDTSTFMDNGFSALSGVDLNALADFRPTSGHKADDENFVPVAPSPPSSEEAAESSRLGFNPDPNALAIMQDFVYSSANLMEVDAAPAPATSANTSVDTEDLPSLGPFTEFLKGCPDMVDYYI